MKAKVILADDHQVMREGLRSLLQNDPDLEVVGEASSGTELVRLAAKHHPDLVLMDVAMPGLNGLEATRRLKREHPKIKIMALTMQADRHYVIGMLKAGASAYLLKKCSYGELQEAMRIVLHGGSYLSPKIAEVVVATLQAGPGHDHEMDIELLTSREREILQLIAEAKKSKEIADQLCISLKTVYTHRRNIMEKLKAKNVAGLTRFAIKNRITSLAP